MTLFRSDLARAVLGTSVPEADSALPARAAPIGVAALVAQRGSAAVAVSLSGDCLRVVWANPAALHTLAVVSDDVVGTDIVCSGPSENDELNDWTFVVSQVVAGAPGLRADEWHSAALDSPDPLGRSVQVLVSGAANGLHVVWLRPVTDGQRLAEEALRESEHRFQALAEHAPVGIVVSEAGARLGFINTRFAAIVGIDRSALLGTQWLKTIHPEDLPGLLAAVDDVMAGTPVEAKLRLVSIADAQRWVQLRMAPVATPRRSTGFIATVEDITARHAWETQLAYQASHDSLTGLANRRSLVGSLSKLLTSHRSRDRQAAVLFCDLDGFKKINDTFGHDAGDRVLIEVAHRLSSTAREYDVVARIAGDEFVVMIGDVTSPADVQCAAKRVLAALARPITVAGEPVRVSASVGVAMAADYVNADALLQAADRCMYEAKRSGGGTYRLGSIGAQQGDVA